MKQEDINRINELARKQRETGLTEDEKKEQAFLRQEYLAAIRANLTASLNNISILEPSRQHEPWERSPPTPGAGHPRSRPDATAASTALRARSASSRGPQPLRAGQDNEATFSPRWPHC